MRGRYPSLSRYAAAFQVSRARPCRAAVSVAATLAASLFLFAAQASAAQPEVVAIAEPAADAPLLDPADVHMVAEYFDADGDEHLCSDWEIWAVSAQEPVWQAHCVEGPVKIHIHLGDGQFINSHAGRTELQSNTAYELHVRFRDDSGNPAEEWSEWAMRSFSTREPGPAGSETELWRAHEGYVVEEFASGLQLPVNIAMVPKPGPHPGDPLMYVTELYGTVKVITRGGAVENYATNLLNFNPTGKFPGSGVKGVTGIAVEPDTGDVLVSLVYDKEGDEPGIHYPKVIRLISDEDGLEATGEKTILDMQDAGQGPSHQVSKLSISPDGTLLVHNGDGAAFFDQAPETGSFLGKILRMTLDGEPLAEGNALGVAPNPFYTANAEDTAEDYVWVKGVRNAFGGAWRLSDETYWEVENGPAIDRLARVVGGEDYGWPGDPTMSHRASYRWNPAHGPVNIEFVETARFGGSGLPPETMGHAFVTESGATWATGPQENGKRIVEFAVGTDGTLQSGPHTIAEYAGVGKATAAGLAAGPDGLYFTDLYKDADYESPIDRGANVLRIRYCGSSCPGASPATGAGPATDSARPAATGVPAAAAGSPPRISGFHVRRRRFAVGLDPHLRGRRAGASTAPRRGTAFAYWLSKPASVWIGIRPMIKGWRVTGSRRCRLFSKPARRRLQEQPGLRRCVLPEARGVRRSGRCHRGSWQRGRGLSTRLRCVLRGPRGVIRGSGKPGRNRRLYAGKLGRHRLRPGRYIAVAHARDRDGHRAKRRLAFFRVTRRR